MLLVDQQPGQTHGCQFAPHDRVVTRIGRHLRTHLRFAGVTGHQVGDRAAQRPLFLAHREGRAGRHQLVTARADRRLAHWLVKNALDTVALGTTRSKPWNAPATVSIWHGTPAAVSRAA